MPMHFQNPMASAPRGLRSRHDGVDVPLSLNFGVGHAGARPLVDPYGNVSQPPSTMQTLMQEAYSMGIVNAKEDIDQRFLVENEDFPDAFNMPNFDEVFMARVSAKTSWMNQCMPERMVTSLKVGGDCLIFNHTQPERLPEESVPNYMTHEREKWSDTIIRWGKGIQMERNFFHTAVGRVIFYYQLEQLNNMIAISYNHSRLCALYYDERSKIKKRSDRLQEFDDQLGSASSGANLLKKSFEDFGILNRDPTKIKQRVSQWTLRFNAQCDGRNPTRIIFPLGASSSWEYADLGPYSQTGMRFDETVNFQQQAANGLKYSETFSTRLDDGRIDHDPAFNPRTIGGYFTIDRDCWTGEYTTEATTVEIFNETQDRLTLFSLQNNAKYFGIWHNYDACDKNDVTREDSYLSHIGQAFMNGITNYWDLYKSQAPQRDLDEITKSIAKQPKFVRLIAERIYENLHKSESEMLGSKNMLTKEQRELLHRVVPSLNIPVHSNPAANPLPNSMNNIQSYLSGRNQQRSDWLNDVANENGFDVTDNMRNLYKKVNSSSKSNAIKDLWKQSSKQDFYLNGKKIYTHTDVNESLERAIRSNPKPSSAMERFLSQQKTEEFDQVFLDDVSDELHSIQQGEVQYLNLRNLTLLSDDGYRQLDFPALLFPLSAQNVVLFEPEDLDFLKSDKWIESVFKQPQSDKSRSFYNSSSRMASLFHSIEVSIIYHVLKNNVNVKFETLVQNASPHRGLMDFTNQLRALRQSNLDVPSFQSDYQRDVQMIREFLANPSQTTFSRLKSGSVQSRTSGRVQPHSPVPMMERFNQTLPKISIDNNPPSIEQLQKKWHRLEDPNVKKPPHYIIGKPVELPEHLKDFFWDHVNKLAPTLDNKQFDAFVNNLSTMVILLNVTAPEFRFKDTPLEHAKSHDLVMNYILQACAHVIIDPEATTKEILEKDVKMMFETSNDKPLQLKQSFGRVMNGVLIKVNETVPSISSKLTNQFASFRLSDKGRKTDSNEKYMELAKKFVEENLKFVNEDKFNLSVPFIKDEAIKLISYWIELGVNQLLNVNANFFDEMYEKTSLSLTYPDLRQVSSQAIAALLVAVSVTPSQPIRTILNTKAPTTFPNVPNNLNYTRGYKTVAGANAMFNESSYVKNRLGDWQANSDKILRLAFVLRSQEKDAFAPDGSLRNPPVAPDMVLDTTLPVQPPNNAAQNVAQAVAGAVQAVASEFTTDDVIELLRAFTIEDAWLYKRFFDYNVIPPIGGRFVRPTATYEMGSVVMCIDGEVGGLHKMPPSISAGEDPKNMMMHMTFAQYYKGIIYSGKELLRVYDVYCRKYLGGNGVQVWDPLNPTHRLMYGSGHELSMDIFAIPMPMWTNNTSSQPYDLTGEYPQEFRTTTLEQEQNRYIVSQVLCDLWGWSNSHSMKEDSYYNTSRFIPKYNTILAQDHTGRWDGKGGYTRTITNCGAWGPNIYNGCGEDRQSGNLRTQYNQISIRA